ncbi:MAG: hypothetical protein A3G34_16430 [Candidatus Lindowbacteria bacterium RIFCSPLOWO2_12_FULL_62_27]|nr:MAG: hypothetical protein A3G34_16430 [Candidatus Lindowbacteria bacterium RIFCSPLOWO2_12_FULL_62_27]
MWGSVKASADRQQDLGKLGYTERRYYPLSNLSWVAPATDTAIAPDSRFAPNTIGGAFSKTPTDPQFTNQLSADDLPLRYVNLPDAWEYHTGSTDVRIGVLDSGIDTTHQDLDGNLAEAVSFVTGDSNPGDKHGHGTYVSSIIAAEANNGIGIAGVCWTCKIVSVKVLNDNGIFVAGDLIEALRWTAMNNVRIINMSIGFFGTSEPSSLVKDAIQFAYDQGILLVAASGNDYRNSVSYPARYNDQVIAVGAIDPTSGAKADFSNYEKDVLDLTAPGVGIYSDTYGGNVQPFVFPDPAGGNCFGCGTSFASPIVAGVAGLVWSENPGLSRDEVRDRLYSTAKDLNTPGKDELTGEGCVDAAAALRVAAFQVSAGKDVIGYPNPYRPRQGGSVTIRPPQDVGAFTVRLYSLDGRLLRTINGTNEVQWDGKTAGGQTVAAGVYLFQASANNLRDEGRITVIDW